MSINDASASERDPETVALFVEESIDGLARVEKLLLEAERGSVRPEMISALFREIHTIKGTSGFLNLPKIQALAHQTEDLLACLRDKTLSARPEHYGALVEACDRMRQLVESVRRTQEEGDAEIEPLLSKLARRGQPDVREAAQASVTLPPMAEGGGDEGSGTDTVRVGISVLDNLMDLMGELVLARNQILQMVARRSETSLATLAACQRLNAVTSEVQAQVMKTRMQPVARAFDKVPRLVRDLVKATGKQVTTHINGTRTEIDKALVETLRDPVMHIVRNAVDHGIEAASERLAAGKPPIGRLSVRASHEDGVAIVEIDDDGRGMDPGALRRHAVERGLITAREAAALNDRQALELVFQPGFSTAARVTSISGRGVGMDVVRTHIEGAGGQVEIASVPGQGTCVRLKLPLSLAIIPVLLVTAGGQRFAIPQASLLELIWIDGGQPERAIERVGGAPIYRLRGTVLPLLELATMLALRGTAGGPPQGTHIVVVTCGEHRCGVVVDAIHDAEEVVVKPIHGSIKRLGCYTGAAVLGDGSVALILDVKGLAARAGVDAAPARAAVPGETASLSGKRQLPAVVFRAGAEVQCLVPLSTVTRLERVPTAAIERLGAMDAIQYHDTVLPIVRPEAVLSLGTPPAAGAEQPLIVFEFGQLVALAVTEIVDIVDVAVDPGRISADGPYTLGRTVVQGRTTLILDVYRIVRELAPHLIRERRKTSRELRVVVAHHRSAMRGALAGYLRSLGVEVVESSTTEAVLSELRAEQGHRLGAVVTDTALPTMGQDELIAALARERPGVPVFAWVEDGDEAATARALAAGARACVSSLRREELTAVFEKHGLRLRDQVAP